jgi:uncharacterized lipoprotein YehR (DUF1307 family)
MKNRIRIVGVIFFALVIAFSIAACDNQTPEEKARTDLSGTWNNNEEDITVTVNGDNFEIKQGDEVAKGTFTVADNVIKIKITEPANIKGQVLSLPYKLEGNTLKITYIGTEYTLKKA